MEELSLFSLAKRRLIAGITYQKGYYKGNNDQLCSASTGKGQKSGVNLQKGRFIVAIKKHLLAVRLLEPIILNSGGHSFWQA